MADTDVKVIFGADVSGLEAGAKQAAASVAASAEQMGKTHAKMRGDFEQSLAPMGRAWDHALLGMLNKKQSFHRALRSMELEAVTMTEETGIRSIDRFVAMQAKKVLVVDQAQGQMLAAQKEGAAQSLFVEAQGALKSIATSAAQAFAGVTAFLAPQIGPAAPAVAAGVSAAVLAEGASVMSAANGYDIPAGVNPLTQLHQNEMVLPAPLADKVRNMTDGGGNAVHLHVHSMDAANVKQFFDRHGSKIMDAVAQQARQFNYGNNNGWAS